MRPSAFKCAGGQMAFIRENAMRGLVLGVVLAMVPMVGGAEELVSERGLKGFITVDRLPVPDQPWLASGREIWSGTCENCHGGNKATGAPKITSTRAWSWRIEQGFDVMVPHAIEGFIGKTFAQMPERGGNLELTDDEVASAVAFMVWASGGAEEALAYAEGR